MSNAAEELEQDTAMQQQLEHTENMKRLYAVPDLSEKLRAAMKELATTKAGKMDFRGKLYATVALRIEMLRKHLCADVSVVTDIITLTDEAVVMKATIMAHGEVLATGYAEEHRSGKGVNSTSALETCETSAVGRALAALGLGGGEYASADELSGAVSQQDKLEQAKKDYAKTIQTIKDGLAEGGDYSRAAEAWFELTDEEKSRLWVAPTKGGPFTTKEREMMKAPEFRQAYFGQQSA